MPPTSIDGTDITGATIDGQDVQEITVDGQTVFTAADPFIIDDFEDGNISEYSGDTGTFTTTTTNPIGGTTSLLYPSSGGGDTTIMSTSGLDNYPSAGDEFSFKVRTSSVTNTQAYVGFGTTLNAVPEFSGDGYFVFFNYNGGKFSFRRFDNGSRTILAEDTSVSYTSNETYTVEVDWGSAGSFTVTLLDTSGTVSTLSASDTEYSSGGFGFVGNNFSPGAAEILFDDATLL